MGSRLAQRLTIIGCLHDEANILFIYLFIYFHWCNDNRAWQSENTCKKQLPRNKANKEHFTAAYQS